MDKQLIAPEDLFLTLLRRFQDEGVQYVLDLLFAANKSMLRKLQGKV